MPRLRRSDTSGPGFRRVKSGKGFRYTTDDGDPVDAATRERAAALVIPPAWTDVWIAPYPNGHVQATGVDAAGRRQYMYHPAWREQKDGIKYDRALELAETLPAARRGVTIDLRRDDLSRERVLAGAFRMLDTGSLRVGSERYAAEHGSFGLSTLLCAHATVAADGVVELRFPAKSGQAWDSDIRDADLAALVRRLKRRGWHRSAARLEGRARLAPVECGGDQRGCAPSHRRRVLGQGLPYVAWDCGGGDLAWRAAARATRPLHANVRWRMRCAQHPTCSTTLPRSRAAATSIPGCWTRTRAG